MNIGFFIDTYHPHVNGVVTSCDILKDELGKRGHKVFVITVKNTKIDIESSEIIRIKGFPFPPLPEHRIGIVYSPAKMRKINNLDLDIIHTHTEFSIGIFGRIMARILNIPVVHTYHTMYEDYMHYITGKSMAKYASKLAKKASKYYCTNCDAVIAPTEKTRNALKSYGLKKNIDVVPTGINVNDFSKSHYNNNTILNLKEEIGMDVDASVILYVGRLAREKSIDIIIKQMPAILKEAPAARLLIVGDGPQRDKLEKLCNKLAVDNYVYFTGQIPRKKIANYYQLGDIFVNASVTETQGLTYLEAMAAGTLVVARYDTNLKGLINDGKNGYFFNTEEELPDILAKVLNNTYKKSTMVNNAYKTVQEFSAENFGKKIEKIYLKLVNNSTNKIYSIRA